MSQAKAKQNGAAVEPRRPDESYASWYYRTHKKRIAMKRRRRYENDPAYKARALERAARWYANPKNRRRKLKQKKERAAAS